MFSGKVQIEICEARSLRATDKQKQFWKENEEPSLDPYVQLHVDEIKLARTSTKLRTSDPVWHEIFTHKVRKATELGLTIFHDAVLPPDYFIANCVIPFTLLIKNLHDGISDFWVSFAPVCILDPLTRTWTWITRVHVRRVARVCWQVVLTLIVRGYEVFRAFKNRAEFVETGKWGDWMWKGKKVKCSMYTFPYLASSVCVKKL